MSIYRRPFKTRDRAGNPTVKKSKKYTAEFRYGGQLYRRAGFVDRETAKFWLDSTRLQLARGEVGMVKRQVSAGIMPLIEAYTDDLETLKRDDMYAYIARQRLERLARECPWMTIGDISIDSFDRWRRGRPTWRGKAIGGRTINQYLDHARELCEWLIDQKKLAVNPLDRAKRVTAPPNDKYRRAGTVDELNRLLAACSEPRRLQYLFRLYVPLRRDSIRALVWDNLHLDAVQPWGELDAWSNKGRRRIRFAIRHDLAQLLRAAQKAAKAKKGDKVFDEVLTCDQLRADLDAAGVAFDDGHGGRRLDFHAFRKTFIKLGKAQGIPMETLHLVLHHRDIRTTRKHYDDDTVEAPLTDAVEKLPTLGPIRIAHKEAKHA